MPIRIQSAIPRRILALAISMVVTACGGSGGSEAARSESRPTNTKPAETGEVSPAMPSVAHRLRRGSVEAAACTLPHEWLLRIWRGYRPDRGAEIQMLPHEFDFVGSGLPHVGPWPYVQDVPMLWYGPGHIRARGQVNRPVTVAGIAPTQAELLRFDGFQAVDGAPMIQAVVPGQHPPRLIVTIIWDAGGMDLLNRWRNAWPYLRSLIPKGTWYPHASVGSSPTSTAQQHATIGTGAFPDHHGLVGHRLRIGGRVTTPWSEGPTYLILPTLADLYDLAMGNEPIVGELGTVSIHLGMLGHGSMWGGGDRDIAVTREVANAPTLGAETFEWNLSPLLRRYFTFPAYVNDVPGFERAVRAVDAADGRIDGRWRNNEIAPLLGGFDTPARTPYQTRVLEELVAREGFGADEVPDLLFVNYKAIDYISHIWARDSLEMRDAVVAQDDALKELVRFLNRQVGRGNWVLAITADHGAMVPPEASGGLQLSPAPIASGIDATFDYDGDVTHVVDAVQQTQIFVNTAELRQNGATLFQVAEYVMALTKGEVVAPGVSVPPSQASERAFQAAFPSSIMRNLPCLPEARK